MKCVASGSESLVEGVLASGSGTDDTRFRQLLEWEAVRTDGFFAAAARLLPAADRRAMLPAEIMRSIYQALLKRMRRDRFRVFGKNYRLGRFEQARLLGAQLLKFV